MIQVILILMAGIIKLVEATLNKLKKSMKENYKYLMHQNFAVSMKM